MVRSSTEATSLMTWTEGKLQLLTCYVVVHRADLYISKREYMLCNALSLTGLTFGASTCYTGRSCMSGLMGCHP